MSLQRFVGVRNAMMNVDVDNKCTDVTASSEILQHQTLSYQLISTLKVS